MTDKDKIAELRETYILRKVPEYGLAFCEFCRWRRDCDEEQRTAQLPAAVFEWLDKAVEVVIKTETENMNLSMRPVTESAMRNIYNRAYKHFAVCAFDCTGLEI